MPPKRSAIGRSTKQAKRRREERASKQVSREKLGKKEIDCTRAFGEDHVILNNGQVMYTTPELAPPLLTTTPTGGRFSSRQI
ncbi:hypothetical protein TNCV_3320991 [Trichonephila clavipes]|nr:hypothetical protein TNCV_3320991 [Trichonephila clavipes]